MCIRIYILDDKALVTLSNQKYINASYIEVSSRLYNVYNTINFFRAKYYENVSNKLKKTANHF